MDNQALEGVEYISLGLQLVLKFVIKKIHIIMDMVHIDFCRPFVLQFQLSHTYLLCLRSELCCVVLLCRRGYKNSENSV